MFSGSPRTRPHHLAGAQRAEASALAGAQTALAAPAVELGEVAPVVRLHRSRLTLAVAITLAALPILVIDNLPATAQAGDARVEAGAAQSSEAPPSTTATTASPATTSTTEAPTTAPTTTEPPATTVTARAVQALAAAAPTSAPTTITTRPPTTTTRPRSFTPGDPSDPATWDKLAQCEADLNYLKDVANGVRQQCESISICDVVRANGQGQYQVNIIGPI